MPKTIRKRKGIELTTSSGNVFADLGFANAKAMLQRADLAHAISSEITKRKLTQTEAAKLLSIDQPNLSRLVRGLGRFSTDRLFQFLRLLKQDVRIEIRPSRHAYGQVRVFCKGR